MGLLLDRLTIQESLQGIRSDGTTRSPLLAYDTVTGDTIIRALDAGGSILFQDAAGDPLTLSFNVGWENVQNTPTTVAGYGLTDIYTDSEVDTLLAAVSSSIPTAIAHLADRNAADLTGSLADARLSSNVPLLSAGNVFVAEQRFEQATTVAVLGARVTGDAVDRFKLVASGAMEWGAGGASARDTNLYRSAADVLRTDDSLIVGSSLTVQGTATFSGAVKIAGFVSPALSVDFADGLTREIWGARRSNAQRLRFQLDSTDSAVLQVGTGDVGAEVFTPAITALNPSGYVQVHQRLGIGVTPSSATLQNNGTSYFADRAGFGGHGANVISQVIVGANSSTSRSAGYFEVLSANSTVPVFVIKGGVTPAAGGLLTEWRLSSNAVVAYVDAVGTIAATSIRSNSFAELTDGTPGNPAAGKVRIFPDTAAQSVRALFPDGSSITLGAAGGAITDGYTSIAGNSGTASASGGAQLSVIGAPGITTAAADGSPDTLTITLGNHSASLLTSGTVADARLSSNVPLKNATSTFVAEQAINRPASTDIAWNHLVTGDLVARFLSRASGRFEWGPGGSSARDTNLYRDAADYLRTDDSFGALALRINGTQTISSDREWQGAIIGTTYGGLGINASGAADGLVPTSDGAGGFTLEAPSGGLIAYTSYRPGSTTNLSTTATSFEDIDASNLVVTFTAPSSGAVLIRLSALCNGSSTSTIQHWNLRSGSTDVTGSNGRVGHNALGSSGSTREHYTFALTGLTPGDSYTYKWGWMAVSGTIGLYVGGEYGPAVMEVWEA